QRPHVALVLAVERDRERAHPLEVALVVRGALLVPEDDGHDGGERENGKDSPEDEDDEVGAKLHRRYIVLPVSSTSPTTRMTSSSENGLARTNFRWWRAACPASTCSPHPVTMPTARAGWFFATAAATSHPDLPAIETSVT